MGAYLDYPAETVVHEHPMWRIAEGHVDQDKNEVYLWVKATDTSGMASFSYSYIYVQLICLYPSGEYTMDTVCGLWNSSFGDMYQDFAGTISVDLNAGAIECYLAMRCAQWDDTGGGANCSISSAADSDPGYEIPGTRIALQTTEAPQLGNIRNTNKYNDNDKISASTNKINIAWDHTGGDAPTKLEYKTGNGAWTDVPNNAYSLGLAGLSPGTTYNIQIKGSNDGGESNTLSISIRTRYNSPTVTASVSSTGLDNMKISWSSNYPLSSITYTVNGASHTIQVNGATSGSFTVSGLSAGSSYTVSVKGTSTSSYDSLQSSTDTVTGTTKAAPALTISLDNKGLESMRLNWSCTYAIKQLVYKVGTAAEKTVSISNAKSGTITLTGLHPNTEYTVRASATTSDANDAYPVPQKSVNGTTLDIARITSIASIIHSRDFNVTFTNPSGTSATIKLWATGNGFTQNISINVTTAGTKTISPTEAQWDTIYKSFPNANTHTMYGQITTHGTSDYTDSQKSSTITLTGIQKTGKTGINNVPRRVQVWVGDSSGKARRCVTWTNVSKIRRTI